MSESIIIDSVFLDFGDAKILRGINMEFKKNKVTGILGRNGSGKSCLLKIIIGQITPQSKHIKYNENKILNLFKIKGLINYLPQHEFHPKSLTIKELVNYYKIDEDFLVQKHSLFAKNMNKKFSALSGGEKRIIEVLLVLESKTKFSILDEPFSQVMPKYIDMVKERIIELKTKKGILITDHKYKKILELSDDLYFMKEGVLKGIKDEQDLKNNGYIR